MRKLEVLFCDHPRSAGETYGEHMQAAFSFGGCMICAGLACMLHGLLPFLFKKTGSSAVRRLNERMVLRGVASSTAAESFPAAGLSSAAPPR